MAQESAIGTDSNRHRQSAEPLAWRRLSQPASEAVHAIASYLEGMTLAQLGELLEESLVLNVNNCWWAEYRAAPMVRSLVAEEMGRRTGFSSGLQLTRSLPDHM